MCTLIAFHGVWDEAPLVIAANRDERYDRPASGPRWSGDPPVLAPRDDAAGGTWMGANLSGVWVGITNRRTSGLDDPARRSRGLLCRDLLGASSAEGVVRAIEQLREIYNPFHIVCGDGEELYLVEYEEGPTRPRALGMGCHIVTNESFGVTAGEPKVLRARSLLAAAGLWPAEPGVGAPPGLFDALGAILADHGAYGPDAICLHGGRYGTRSSAVWRLRGPSAPRERPVFEVIYADGPPCATPFVPIPSFAG